VKAEVVLTSSESKRLIAKACVQLDAVKAALARGRVIVTRGTTNAFVAEELLGRPIDKPAFTAGYVDPQGFKVNPRMPREIVIEKGEVKADLSLDDVLDKLGRDDVVFKGANALGPDGVAGVLVAGATGGTLGKFLITAMARGVNVVVPVGLDKFIPASVLYVSRLLGMQRIDYAMGQKASLVPVFGQVVTEIEAVRILANATAIPIASGGIGGAEGCVALLIEGEDSEVKKSLEIIEKIKGEKPVGTP